MTSKNIDMTTLHKACQSKNNIEVVKSLVEQGAKIDGRDEERRTPLHHAAYWSGDVVIIKYLIKSGVDINCKDNDSCTPMHLAAKKGFVDAVKVLAELGGNINAVDNEGLTPMLAAICNGATERKLKIETAVVVDTLIKAGADMNCRMKDTRFTPLHEASHTENACVVKCLLTHGANISCQDVAAKMSPLHTAAHAGNVEVIQILLDSGAEIDCKDANSSTPLVHAVMMNKEDAIRYLVKRGANINAKDGMNKTPLHQAIFYKKKSVLTLLELGASTESKDVGGYAAMEYCLVYGNGDAFDFLTEFGVDINKFGQDRYEMFMEEVMEEQIAPHLINHLVKLQALGFEIEELFEQYINMKDKKLKVHHQKCLDEIKKLKDAKIKDGEKEASLYDLLHMHPQKRSPFYKTKDFEKLLDRETRNNMYPIYCHFIMGSYRQAMSR